ncbi:hypothetical protein QAD02_016928 [Eretmocerus hayati]|uniref:Uncharacterized protein n=1 Tax=Eretmocerus hayati TaxID=131215 RepID=A0ACC2PCG3_9HYME|nr:hypothetical protein QAD02_016928 [Eretmocerus hayati]
MSSKISVLEKDFEDIEEPSVLSLDPHERKLARRLRIQKRAEALQKLEATEGEDVTEHTLTEKQIIASAELLEKLIDEGDEVVSNVRVANDARELERRREVRTTSDELLALLDKSSDECRIQYDMMSDKWHSMLDSNDPLEIKYAMESQKRKCEEILAKKDAGIAELKRELQYADDRYYEDQRKQKEDIILLTERIENQISHMENIFARELDLIEKTLESERDSLVERFQHRWEVLYKEQQDVDAEGDEKRDLVIKDFEEEVERLMRDHDEEFRQQKIRLENECQAMDQEVERVKALCLLNSEKLTYNFTILKSREEEMAIVKSQQKRKLNKLQSIIANLKKTYSDLRENSKLEMERLSNKILKAHKSIASSEERRKHFTRVNEKRYLDIWNMNAEHCNEMVKKILAADKFIHERTLGIPWMPPKYTLPRKEDLPSYVAAMNKIRKRKQEEKERLKIYDCDRLERTPSELELERRILNNILKQISECSGYLIEDKLQELIASRTEEEKTIIRLDNVFQALSISLPEEIGMLLHFFLPYAYCPICILKDDTVSSSGLASKVSFTSTSTPCDQVCEGCTNKHVKKLVDAVREEVERPKIKEISDKLDSSSSDSFGSESASSEEYKSRSDDLKPKPHLRKFMCEKGHLLEIQAAHVTKVMKEIVKKMNAAEQKAMHSFEERLKDEPFSVSRYLSDEDVENFWASYRNIFGPEKEKLWDAILIGLTKYHEVLKERQKICDERESLERRNAELRRLLDCQTPSVGYYSR